MKKGSKVALLAAVSVLASAVGSGALTAGAQTQPVTLSMFITPSSNIVNLKTNWFTTYLQKTFNVNFNFDIVPGQDASTKQSLLEASGNYPDIFWSAGWTQESLLHDANQGIVIPLNSLIKQYAPNVLEAINTYPGLKQQVTAPDGNIYALPNVNYCLHCDFAAKFWVNTDIMKKLHLSMPTTTAQFTTTLAAIKKAGYIPLTGSVPDGWHGDPTTFLMNSFIYDDGQDYFYLKGNHVEFAPIQPQWKQGLEYIHSLYQAGYIDKAIFAQSMDSAEQKENGGKAVFVSEGASNDFILNYGTQASHFAAWRSLAPLKGPSGVHYAAFFGTNSGGGFTFAITNKASQAEQEAVMKILNFVWTPTGTQMLDFGPVSKYWTYAKKGQKGLNGEQALFNTDWNTFYNGNAQQNEGWNQLGPFYQSEAWRNGGVAIPPFSPNGSQSLLQLETEMNYAGKQPKFVYPTGDTWVSSSQEQQYALLQTNIDNYVNQWTSEFEVGNKSITTDWNTYVQGLQKLQLSQYLQISQSIMGKPFNTSPFNQSTSDVKFLLSDK